MNIVYLGSGRFGLPCLDAMARSSHRICLVVTQPAQPAGRGPVIEMGDVNASATVGWIADYRPDLIVVISFGQKISNEVVNIAPKRAINVHASLLPKYRGAAPVNWAIVNGEKETGITVITVAERMDAGDILAQVKTEIGWDETAGDLGERLAKLAAPLLIDTIDRIAGGTAVYKKQDESQVIRAPKLHKTDGNLDFAEPAQVLRRRILGFWPWPEAAAFYESERSGRSERVIFAKSEILRTANPENLTPGTLDENLNVVCGQNRLQIVQLKPENARLMSFADFVNGRHVSPGDRFVKISDSISSTRKK
jgi:methionyl-tRNA formyltransferase